METKDKIIYVPVKTGKTTWTKSELRVLCLDAMQFVIEGQLANEPFDPTLFWKLKNLE